MKLHLGCGQIYLKGYVNIDYPLNEQTVQKKVRADIYQDITTLHFKESSIEEIRLHHVLEHFPRYTSLALLCKWRDWLKIQGKLIIETPDVLKCFKMMSSPLIRYENKQQIMRHIFGSHEASWAVHYDGWYKKKYSHILKEIGFNNVDYQYQTWGNTYNITVTASKTNEDYDFKKYRLKIKDILTLSTIKTKYPKGFVLEKGETDMLALWLDNWTSLYKRRY